MFTHFHVERSFIDTEAVAMFTEMNDEVFDADGVAFRNVGNIGMPDLVAVDDDDQAGTDGLHIISAADQHAGILSQSDADAGRI